MPNDSAGVEKLRAQLGRIAAGDSPNGDSPNGKPPPLVHLSDVGNGKRLVARHGAEMRHVAEWGRWLTWAGTHWDDAPWRAEARAKEMVLSLWAEAKGEIDRLRSQAEEANDDEHRERINQRIKQITAILKWALKSEAAGRIAAALKMAESEPGIPLRSAELDADPMALNVLNGTVDLRRGRLRPHDPADLIGRVCPVVFDPAATCPTWDRALSVWTCGNTEVQDYLRRAAGYTATGRVDEQCLFFLYGPGGNGKSIFLLALLHVLGSYAWQAPSELLMRRQGEAHPTERCDLFRRRLVATIETDEGVRMAESLTKQLTGGDRVTGRRMREDFWSFDATHKLWLAGNHKPAVKGNDLGIWRRIRLVPFEAEIVDRDPKLLDKLKAEAPGILRWLVRGAREWQERGLADPEEITQATREYRDEQDLVQRFLNECCFTGPAYRTRAAALYAAFKRFCEVNGERAMSATRFGPDLERRGFRKHVSNGVWYEAVGVNDLAFSGGERDAGPDSEGRPEA